MAAVFRGNALLLFAWIDAGVSEAERVSIAITRRLQVRMFVPSAAVRVAGAESGKETVIAAFAL